MLIIGLQQRVLLTSCSSVAVITKFKTKFFSCFQYFSSHHAKQYKDTHVALVQLILLLLTLVDTFLENTSLVVATQQEYLNVSKQTYVISDELSVQNCSYAVCPSYV